MTDSAPFDEQRAHRWFAVEFNNAAWEIVEAAERSPDELERMIHLAHAACLHWSFVGSPVNRLRALSLLAHAHAVASHGSLAVEYATEACRMSDEPVADQTPFDRAAILACMAHALRAAGDFNAALAWQTQAESAAAELPEDDRGVLERLRAL